MGLSTIRAQLKDLHTARANEIPGVVTVSIGVAAFEETTNSGLLLKFADDALYQAKRAGRDRVVVAHTASERKDALVSSPLLHLNTSS